MRLKITQLSIKICATEGQKPNQGSVKWSQLCASLQIAPIVERRQLVLIYWRWMRFSTQPSIYKGRHTKNILKSAYCFTIHQLNSKSGEMLLVYTLRGSCVIFITLIGGFSFLPRGITCPSPQTAFALRLCDVCLRCRMKNRPLMNSPCASNFLYGVRAENKQTPEQNGFFYSERAALLFSLIIYHSLSL